jgi:putative endopeptidase
LNAALHDGAADVDGLSQQQRFFLSYATVWRQKYTDERLRLLAQTDPHSPSHYRCNGPLSNFEPFREAFQPADGATMLRSKEEIVAIW